MNMQEEDHVPTFDERPGHFNGHLIPGLPLFGLGFVFLILTLQRTRNLPPGKTFCQVHVPEKNPVLMRIGGMWAILMTTLGALSEFQSAGFTLSLHVTLYLGFQLCGWTALIESRGRLPPDTIRVMLALQQFLCFIAFKQHSAMKEIPTDSLLHLYVSGTFLAGAVAFAYSVRYPNSMIVYITSWAIMVFQGVWLITVGLYFDFINISMHNVSIIWCLQVLCIAFIVMGVSACAAKPGEWDNSSSELNSEYDSLNKSRDTDDESEEEDGYGDSLVV